LTRIRLDFCVGVAVNFAVQFDLLKSWCFPFHFVSPVTFRSYRQYKILVCAMLLASILGAHMDPPNHYLAFCLCTISQLRISLFSIFYGASAMRNAVLIS